MLWGRVRMSSSAITKKVPKPVDVHVGNQVRTRRLMLGLSQEKLGHALGLTFQQVQKYEKGTNRMGSSRLQQAANILQVPVTFFFEGAPGQTKLDAKLPHQPIFPIFSLRRMDSRSRKHS